MVQITSTVAPRMGRPCSSTSKTTPRKNTGTFGAASRSKIEKLDFRPMGGALERNHKPRNRGHSFGTAPRELKKLQADNRGMSDVRGGVTQASMASSSNKTQASFSFGSRPKDRQHRPTANCNFVSSTSFNTQKKSQPSFGFGTSCRTAEQNRHYLVI